VAEGFDDPGAERLATVELPLDEATKLRFTLAGGETLDEERSSLLEELGRELGERLT